jgi:hypothetical protein
MIDQWPLVFSAAFVGSSIAAVAGTGGGIILLPILISVFGVREAVPFLSVLWIDERRIHRNRGSWHSGNACHEVIHLSGVRGNVARYLADGACDGPGNDRGVMHRKTDSGPDSDSSLCVDRRGGHRVVWDLVPIQVELPIQVFGGHFLGQTAVRIRCAFSNCTRSPS